MSLHVIILAAGKGTRMRSSLPKVLHPVAGRPMVSHVIATARQLNADKIHLVYGHGGEVMQAKLNEADVEWVLQAEQLGTGHAVAQATPAIPMELLPAAAMTPATRVPWEPMLELSGVFAPISSRMALFGADEPGA